MWQNPLFHAAGCIGHRSRLCEPMQPAVSVIAASCVKKDRFVFGIGVLFLTFFCPSSGFLLSFAYISFDLFCRIKHYAYIASVIQTDCYMKYFKIYKKRMVIGIVN